MKKFINFIKKNKIGAAAIEAMVVVPIWLGVILFIGRTLIISNSRYTLTSETLPIASVISKSTSRENAQTNLTTYMEQNKVKDIDVNTIEMKLISLPNGTKNSDSDGNWDEKDAGGTVRVKVTINTPFDDMRFTSVMIGNQKFDLFPAKFTSEFTVVLNFK